MDTSKATISVSDLEKLLADPSKLKVLDCSTQMGREAGDCPRIEFLKSHIPGAIFLDLDNLKDQKSDLPYMMPSEAQFIGAMKCHGIKLSDTVVCYDGGPTQFFGYRAAWMMKTMGHPSVFVLDGGFPAWKKEGKKVEATDASACNDDFAYKQNPDKIKNFDQIQEWVSNTDSFQLLDARGPPMFEKGNIPGSTNVPFSKFVNMENKTMKSAEDRTAAASESGIDLTKPIVVSCQGGIAATCLFGALSDIHKSDLALYDGSFAEYSKKAN